MRANERPWYEDHGHLGEVGWPRPQLVAGSSDVNRADQGSAIRADEYLDSPQVLRTKVEQLADLIRRSSCCVAYTGAGLSRASGIPDYATKAKASVSSAGPKLKSSLDAEPTAAHRALTRMERADLLHHWVQQNHDGLPQKAGFPQSKINEIHGAWFDPSNPVVPFSGNLRGDLFEWLLQMEQKAQLCLCLGTSLSGMNADRVASGPAERFFKKEGQGTVIINLQRTGLDDRCSLRIWARLDETFALLTEALALPELTESLPDQKDVVWTPYDTQGALREGASTQLDLRAGAKVIIAHPLAPGFGTMGKVLGKRHGGHYVLELGDRRMVLGRWWMDVAQRGQVERLPIVNVP